MKLLTDLNLQLLHDNISCLIEPNVAYLVWVQKVMG